MKWWAAQMPASRFSLLKVLVAVIATLLVLTVVGFACIRFDFLKKALWPTNPLVIVLPATWVVLLVPLFAAWFFERSGDISLCSLIRLEIAWLSIGIVATFGAWWVWYVDFRNGAEMSGMWRESGWWPLYVAYLDLAVLSTLAVAAISQWRRAIAL
jgi:hypothetical protein